MRSKASFKGHPIHPALVMFPFAALWLAFLFNLAGAVLSRPALWSTGGMLAVVGIVAALGAAIPGFIDYLGTVPPRSTGKVRATTHMILNLSAVTLFVVAWLLRGDPGIAPPALVLVLQGMAVAFLSTAGWMGGTLVSRNQIGVDHRYAGAGKWRETRVHANGGAPIRVAEPGELEVNQMKLVHVGDRRLVLARTAAGYVAFDDRCTHRGASLADGALMCETVQCPWHGSQFDVGSGAVRSGPAGKKIETYPVESRTGGVFLKI